MKVGIIGGSGYVGGELLRLLIQHPEMEVVTATSRVYAGEYIFRIHPNLRGFTDLKFSPMNLDAIAKETDLTFVALPHGSSVEIVPKLVEIGQKVIDLGADFRLKDKEDYVKYYGWEHPTSELLKEAAYGLPELNRKEIKKAKIIAVPGCMSTSAILGLAPTIKEKIIEENRIAVDVKIVSSGAGAKPTRASHHPERFGGVRCYKPIGHRHIAEIEQELGKFTSNPISISFSPHSVNMVRGILSTIHSFSKKELETPHIWKTYREMYGNEPFIRLVRDKKGLYRLPDPKNVMGTNFCDIGFEIDSHSNRLVIFSAIDNLTKGAASQAIQCLNIAIGINEETALKTPSLHPA
jgi:N-acetyl-gamma-glutamyl-phosphate/LysW-gamma-L-alpha-aminoadipyl-6-phosphate reductase